MNINDMTIEDIETRMTEIGALIDTEGADIPALTEEVRKMNERKDFLNQREELRKTVAGGAGTVIRDMRHSEDHGPFGVDSAEYRTAWLKHMQGRKLTNAEQRAFDKAGGAISTITANAIMEEARKHAPILERMIVINGEAAISYYVEGTNAEAEDHTENATITAADDTLTKIDLNPTEITKLVQVSKAALKMSVNAFERWLTDALGKAIARKLNAKIFTALLGVAASAGTTITADSVLAMLGTVKGSTVTIACNNKTLFTKLLPLQDNSKHGLVNFEGGKATVYGMDVLVDDHIADDTILAGDMEMAVAELSEDVNVEKQFDIDTNSWKFLGSAMFDVKPGVNGAFAKLANG